MREWYIYIYIFPCRQSSFESHLFTINIREKLHLGRSNQQGKQGSLNLNIVCIGFQENGNRIALQCS